LVPCRLLIRGYDLTFTHHVLSILRRRYTIELKYCIVAGANLSGALQEQPQIAPINLTKPALIISLLMGIITIGGFLLVIGRRTRPLA